MCVSSLSCKHLSHYYYKFGLPLYVGTILPKASVMKLLNVYGEGIQDKTMPDYLSLRWYFNGNGDMYNSTVPVN